MSNIIIISFNRTGSNAFGHGLENKERFYVNEITHPALGVRVNKNYKIQPWAYTSEYFGEFYNSPYHWVSKVKRRLNYLTNKQKYKNNFICKLNINHINPKFLEKQKQFIKDFLEKEIFGKYKVIFLHRNIKSAIISNKIAEVTGVYNEYKNNERNKEWESTFKTIDIEDASNYLQIEQEKLHLEYWTDYFKSKDIIQYEYKDSMTDMSKEWGDIFKEHNGDGDCKIIKLKSTDAKFDSLIFNIRKVWKHSYYNKSIFPSIQVPDFFTPEEVKEVRDNYKEMEKLILEEYFEEEPNTSKITCMHVMDLNSNKIGHIARINSKTGKWNTRDGRAKWDVSGHDGENESDFKLFMSTIDTDWMYDVRELLVKKFNDMGRDSGELVTLSFFDFLFPFETHCDGFHLSPEFSLTKREDPKIKKLFEKEKSENELQHLHQGLINLDAEPHHGTLIFDQWYPMCHFIDYSKEKGSTWTTGNYPYKSSIQFYKGDEPTRWGEPIRNFTNEYMDKEDYDIITEHIKNKKNLHEFDQFSKESGYGLSLEKELLFGQPGTLVSWDAKKFHKTKPFPRKTYEEHVKSSGGRLCLQYECIGDLLKRSPRSNTDMLEEELKDHYYMQPHVIGNKNA